MTAATWSEETPLTLEEERERLEVLIASGRTDALFEPYNVPRWARLKKHWPAAFEVLLSQLKPGERAGVRRAVEVQAAAASDDPDSGEAEEWPGDGSIERYLSTPAPARVDFIKDRVPGNRASALVGLGGSSKTTVLKHLAIGGVLGRLPWGWEVARTGSAALFLAEDTGEGVHRSLATMADAMALSGDECVLLSERLSVFPLAGKPSRLLRIVGGVLTETGLVEKLIGAVRSLPPPVVFVGLDPALALTEGNEMDPAHMRRLGELVDRIAIELDAAVMIAAHAAKNLAQATELNSHAARGSGALTDAVRAEFALRTMTETEARAFAIDSIEQRKGHVQLTATKGNEMPPSAFVPLWLRRSTGGVLEGADLIHQDTGRAPTVGPREVRALEILRGLAAVSAPKLGAWREACIAADLIHAESSSAREKQMDRIRDALLGAGLIEHGFARGIYVPTSPG